MKYRRVDHRWYEPVGQEAHLGYAGHTMTLNAFAEHIENIPTVARLCFLSYLHGPGRKIILGRGWPDGERGS